MMLAALKREARRQDGHDTSSASSFIRSRSKTSRATSPARRARARRSCARSWSGCRRMPPCTSPACARPTAAKPKAGSSRRRCLPEQMIEFPREEVYARDRSRDRDRRGAGRAGRRAGRVYRRRRRRRRHDRRALADSGDDRQLAHDCGRRCRASFAARTRWASIRASATAVVVGATGSIGGACVRLIAPQVEHVVLVARNETRLRKFHEQSRRRAAVRDVEYTTDISPRGSPRRS